MANTFTNLLFHIIFSTKHRAPFIQDSQVPAIRRYIRTQEEHHARLSFKDELIALLRKNKIEFDERYLLD